MGDNFQTVVDLEVAAEEADELARSALDWLTATGVLSADVLVSWDETASEGLVIATGRTVFPSMTGDWWVTCPRCGWATDPEQTVLDDVEGPWEVLMETIGEWHSGGSGVLDCPRCRGGVELNDWHWDPPWAFGCLGFTFWNWPDFSPEFLRKFSAKLGHRTAFPYGKL